MGKHKGLNFYKKKKELSTATIREIWSWIFIIFIAVFLAFVIIFSVGMKTSVIGESMEPSLYNGQNILIDRFIYNIISPKRGDVIVFLPNGNQNAHYYVKRIVGLPGETIQVIDGRVYIDGKFLEEDETTFDKIADAGIAVNEIVLGNDEYFVLGDNRNNSEDSRNANIGSIKKNTIVGKAWYHMASSKAGMNFIK
ncbi:MAG TPA: signal peptidase I [Lachnospiraceae bacterium]|nr:signal peptidase I [Lachnospiraceae bacterium]